MSTESIVNLNEALEEARRLTKVLGRDVEATSIECCGYDKTCSCGGAGLQYRLVFRCGHEVGDGTQAECEENDCVHKEYLAFCKRDDEREAMEVVV